jgi:hypothetical protein
MANDNEPRICAHEPCVCEVPLGQAYCSASCQHTATSGPPREETICECGHPACPSR